MDSDRGRRPALRYRRGSHADNGGTVSINDNGTGGRCTTDDFIEYSPAADFAGTETFTYTISTATERPTRPP